MWEMRGVNARGLDVRLRLPEGLEGLETALRAALKAALTRGNVTVSLRLRRDDDIPALRVDEAQLDRVLSALDQVQERGFAMGVTLGQPTAADVLNQRGVLIHAAPDTENTVLIETLTGEIDGLIQDFLTMRAKEGAALKQVLVKQLDDIATLLGAAKDAVSARKDASAAAFQDAVARVVADVDQDRLAQELALLAVKQDVTEELDRLDAHIAAGHAMIADPKPMGRKLDFLAQEFNREANTLCSKAQNSALTAIGLDLKAVIDQMREQIQNVE